MNTKKLPLALISILLLNTSTAQTKMNYPNTKKGSQVDDYFGTKIEDPYRWLENDTSKQTENWVLTQNNYTNSFLNKIPNRNKIKERLTELWNYPKTSAPSKEGEYYLSYKNNGLQNQSVLYVKKGLNGREEVLLDPNQLSKDGTIAIQATAMSKNQKYFAYAVSASGSDWQEIYIIDFESKKLIPEKIEYVKFTGISWKGDDGFYYSGYDKPQNDATKYSTKTEFQKIFYHKIGTPTSEDILIYEDKEHPLRYVSAGLTEDERFLVLNISEGTDGSEIKVKDLMSNNDKSFTTLIKGFTQNASIIDNIGNKLLVLTNENAPNYKLVLMDYKNLNSAPKTIIAESKNKLESVTTGGGKLFANYLKNAYSEVIQFNIDGTLEKNILLPGLGTASGFYSHKNDKTIFYTFSSYVYPPTIFSYDIETQQSNLYKNSEIKFNHQDYVTQQVFFPSLDGTTVSMFITHKKDIKLDGNNPTLLYGYGGFNISLTPSFSVANLAFLENGGVYCVANLRGGGEYGEKWHQGGMLDRKQNVFNDFIAAAKFLTISKYTNPKKLAIRGGSNGGLLVGACITQKPELFAVAIPQVGVLDMLRFHKFTVGWGWVVEYGSSDNKQQFDYLIKYSPLHNIKKDICYPATMITTADHDDRVVPAHSFKFAATLQAAQHCSNPILIRIDSKAGHGAGKPTNKLIDEATDIWSFIFYNMGVKIK